MVFRVLGLSAIVLTATAHVALGEGALQDPANAAEGRVTQAMITGGALSRDEIRLLGRTLFSLPFTGEQGFGDGPAADTPAGRTALGGRPSLGHNGSFLRINGLDAQTCLECHNVLSRARIPMTFAVGGTGGITTTVLGAGGASFVNANDDPDQINTPDGGPSTGANMLNGRQINPPFIFGSGGVELVANEMTQDLQRLKAQALANPGTAVALHSKGVGFGTLRADTDGTLDASGVEGIDADPALPTFLVVQPFGRKGDNLSTRSFDINAMQFHMGIQPVEVFGVDTDADGDGVSNELLIGELSALSIFMATAERPVQINKGPSRHQARVGGRVFDAIGCAGCHIPQLETTQRTLALRFPEVANDPDANVFYAIDLTDRPAAFRRNNQGGVSVRMFSDLKRHDMGPTLAEADGFGSHFITARLWGVADTAPYLHDGRALTLTQAIELHGGEGSEAKPAVDRFRALSADQQAAVLTYLGTLRTPTRVGRDLDQLAEQLAREAER